MPAARYSPSVIPSAGVGRGVESLAFANPLEDVLSAVSSFGQKAAISGAADEANAAVLGGENVTPKLGLTPAGQAYNEAAQRAFQSRSEGILRAKANELATQYDGRHPTDPDNFSKVYGAVRDSVVQAVPEQWRAPIAFEAGLRHDEAVTAIRGRAQAIAFQHDQQSIEDGRKADAEEAASMAQIGRSDLVDAALAKSAAKAQSLVEIGAINQDEADIRKKNAREVVASETIFHGFMLGHVSLAAVQSGAVGAELSAPVRDHLVSKIESQIAHVRSEQNHALAVADHNVRVNSSQLDAITIAQDHGIPIDEKTAAFRDQLLAAPGSVDANSYSKGIASRATIGIAREVATARPEQIQATRAEWAANPPTSEAEYQRRERVVKAFDFREQSLKDDAAAYATSVLPDKFPPVILPAPNDPGFDAALSQAATNVGLIRAQWGVTANPLTKDQQQRFATSLRLMSWDEKAAVLGRVETAMGADAAVIHEGLAKQGALVEAHAGIVAAQGWPDVAASMLQGQQALDLGNVVAPPEKDVAAAAYAASVPAMYPASETAQAQIRKSALAVAASIAGPNGDVIGALPQAFKVVGAQQGKFGGSVIALPMGVASNIAFADRVQSVTDSEIAAMGSNRALAEPQTDFGGGFSSPTPQESALYPNLGLAVDEQRRLGAKDARLGELGNIMHPDRQTVSSEVSITVEDPRKPGNWIIIPSLVKGQSPDNVRKILSGKPIPEDVQDIAVKRAMERVAGGAALESYPSIAAADAAGEARHSTFDPFGRGPVNHLGYIADALRSGQARLESRGEGRYFVTIGATRANNADGTPFTLDFAKIKAKGVEFRDLPPPLAAGASPSGSN